MSSPDVTQWTKFDWIEFEQPKAGQKGRIHGCILKSGFFYSATNSRIRLQFIRVTH